MHDDTFTEVLRFQFAQHEVGKATLKVIPAKAASAVDAEGIVKEMNRRLAGRMTFDIEIVDDIPMTTHGKSVFVDQKLDTDQILLGNQT